MTEQRENTKRIAKNTLMLYIRMMFGMLVSLYTSRVILQALGVEDYGIYNVVGGFVAMFSMISSSLSSAVSRFLTFELGKGDIYRLKKVFSTSLFIHIVLALIIILLIETIGVWFLNTQLTIPKDRLFAANCVFQASVLSFVMSLLSVPYSAAIVAHEHLNIFAYIGIGEILLRLFVVIFVSYSNFIDDRLITYSLLLVFVSVMIQIFYMYYCRHKFQECKGRIYFYNTIFKEMGTFAFWNFIGCTAVLLKDQGVNILLNIFIGPIINASRAIATTVNNSISSFANNFMTALNPQIIKSYASSDYDYMNKLIERGSRFSFYIMYLFILPVMIETEFILEIWLGNYPVYTIQFVRLVLIMSAIDILSNTLINLQLATGNIRNYQLVVGGTLMLNFPLSYLFLRFSFSPVCVYLVAIFIAVCCLFLRLLFLQKMVKNFSFRGFLNNVLVNVLKVALTSSIIPIIVRILMEDGWIRFLIVIPLCIFCTMCSIYKMGCSNDELVFIKEKLLSFYRKKI